MSEALSCVNYRTAPGKSTSQQKLSKRGRSHTERNNRHPTKKVPRGNPHHKYIEGPRSRDPIQEILTSRILELQAYQSTLQTIQNTQ